VSHTTQALQASYYFHKLIEQPGYLHDVKIIGCCFYHALKLYRFRWDVPLLILDWRKERHELCRDLVTMLRALTNGHQAWISNNTAPHYVRAVAVGIVISIANCSAFIGTFIYLQTDAPKYVLGHAVSLGALVCTVILAVAQCIYLHWENKKRNMGERDGRLGQENEGSFGHRHPNFRYTL
jgi:hypothetical protein